MAFELAVELGTSVLRLKPGSSATLDVGITNIGSLVQHYQVQLLGLPGPGMTGPPNEPLKLLPKESGRVQVLVTLPADSPVPAGQYRIGVLVRSPFKADVSRTAELILDVGSVAGFTLTAYPEVVEGRGSGDFTLTARNTGNTPAQLSFDIRDEQGVARVRLQPEILQVPPLGQAAAAVNVRLPGRLTGSEKQAQIKITASDARDPAHPVNAAVRMVIRPLLSQALVNILVGLLTVVGLAVAALVVVPMVMPPPAPTPAPSSPIPVPSEIQTTSEGENPPDPPEIVITPADPKVGQKVTFTATTSEDVNYTWGLVGPDGLSLLATAATLDHFDFTMTQEGQHLVTLTITRKDGPGSATTQKPFEVGAKPPSVVTVTLARSVKPSAGVDSKNLECPAGMVPVSGGMSDDSDLSDEPFWRASRPEGADKWLISTRSMPARKLTYYATCIQPVEGMKTVTKSDQAPMASPRLLTATCPAGMVLLGGGVTGGTKASDTAYINELGPSSTDGTTWTSWTAVIETVEYTTAKVYAICAPTPAQYSVQTTDVYFGGGSQVATGTVTCPAGDVLAGGAVLQVNTTNPTDGLPPTSSFLRLRTSRPTGSPGTPGQGWTVTADTYSDNGDGLTLVAICGSLE